MTLKPDYSSMLAAELAGFIDPATGLVKQESSHEMACPLCRGGQEEELFIKRGFRFVLCRNCGLVFANPQVITSESGPLYEHADSLQEWARIVQTDSQASFDLGIYGSIIDLCRPLLAAGHRKEPVECLDVSMRAGLLTACKAVSEWSLEFMDFAGPTRRLGRSRYPSQSFYSNFDEVIGLGKRYDVVISMEAMEHFSDPLCFASKARSVLKDGGIFCGVLSNVESLLVRLLGADAPMFDGLYQKFFFHSSSLVTLLGLARLSDVTFHSLVPCTDAITRSLNKMIPDHLIPGSDEMIRQIAKCSESSLLGYKLMFAARKEES